MRLKPLTYTHTLHACYGGYIVQAIIANLAPLFFVVFQTAFDVSFEQIGRLILLTFGTQLVVDLLSVKFVDKIGYRAALVLAHICSVAGLVMLGTLPRLLPDPYTGLTLSVIVYAVGGRADRGAHQPHRRFPAGGGQSLLDEPAPRLLFLGTGAGHPDDHGLHRYHGGRRVVGVSAAVGRRAPGQSFPCHPDASGAASGGGGQSPAENALFLPGIPCRAADVALRGGGGAFDVPMVLPVRGKGPGCPQIDGDLLGPCLFGLLMGVGRTVYGIWGRRFDLKRRCSRARCSASPVMG